MSDIYGEFSRSRFFHEPRMERRSVDELIGLAAGITADGKVNQHEAEFLKDWIERNTIHVDDPVVNILYRRLRSMLADGVLDEDESAELLAMLHCFNAPSAGLEQTEETAPRLASSLPFNNPIPDIYFPMQSFIFTGVMAFGPRSECERLVIERGGLVGKGISKKIDYLVIGTIANEQWLHSSYGTKIKKAVELRESGVPLAIIGEDHWQKAMFG